MTKHTSRDAVWSETLKLAEIRSDRPSLGRRGTFTPGEVAARIDDPPSDRTVRDVVATMADLGHLERARTQGRYRHPDARTTASSAARSDDSGPVMELKTTPADHLQEEPVDEEIGGAGDVVDDVHEDSDDVDLEELLDDWHPGRTLDEKKERKAVGKAALRLLIDDGGQLMREEFVDELLPEYDVDGQSEDTWWRNSVRPALMTAVQAGHAERHHGPPHTYEWIGEQP